MIAFVCNSPVQLMRAIHMKIRYEVCSSSGDIFITDKCAEYKKLAENLKKTDIFSNVYIFELSGIKKHVFAKLYFANTKLLDIIKKKKYNKLFAFNIEDELTRVLFNRCKKYSEFEYHCVEDCPSIYALYTPKKNSQKHSFRWLGLDQQAFHINHWWFSYPEVMEIPMEIKAPTNKLTPISVFDEEYVDIVNFIFEYQTSNQLEEADILIMDESHFTDNLMIDNADIKLYKKIQKYCKDKKVVVKLHPRTKQDRYIGDFAEMEYSSTPWELYVLNRCRTNKKDLIQIGIVCGTLLSDKFMFDLESKKLILAPMFCDKIKTVNSVCRVNSQIIDGFEAVKYMYDDPDKYRIIYSESDLINVLDVLNH